MVQIRPQSPQAIILKLLVPSNFEHGTEFYAEQLCITFNYLNKIVKQVLGTSTKAYISCSDACRKPADSCNTPRSPWRGLPRS